MRKNAKRVHTVTVSGVNGTFVEKFPGHEKDAREFVKMVNSRSKVTKMVARYMGVK